MKESTFALVDLATNAMAEVYLKAQRNLMVTLSAITFTFLLAGMPVSADAATFIVTNSNDSGAGSLRQAVLDANSNAGADTINFAINAPATVILTSGALTTSGTLTINGSSIHPTVISGNNASRVFDAAVGSSLTLNYLNITGGLVNLQVGLSNGGGIHSIGTVVLNNCAVYGNTATNGTGGGIYAIAVHMLNSTVSGNSATISGGGLQFESTQSSTIESSTIAFNTSGTGGGVHNAQAPIAVRNSIIAHNTATTQRPDWSLAMISQGYNLIGNTAGTNISGNSTGNQINVSPGLLPLAFNNGSTQTHAFPLTSVVMEHGDPSRVGTIDQRGAIRGVDGGGNSDKGVDMGAYEKQRPLFDFNGDERPEVSIMRVPSISIFGSTEGITQQVTWFFQLPSNTMTSVPFGLDNDKPVPADYDGDGRTDIAIYRPSNGTWYISGSAQGFYTVRWGISTDVPVPTDFDADGKADPTVYRNGQWHILGSSVGYLLESLGGAGDKPVAGYYDNDGFADTAVFNAGVWTIDRTNDGLVTRNLGVAGDVAVQGDYDGDGKVNIAVFRPGNGTWYISTPDLQSFTAMQFGLSTDRPVPADYDGDGKTDIAVYRNGTWYISASRIGFYSTVFGQSNDKPVEGVYVQ